MMLGGGHPSQALEFSMGFSMVDDRTLAQPGWVVVSNIFYFHPYLGKIPILTNIFQRG